MFKNFNPIALFIYFVYVLFISVFSFNPIILTAGILGAVFYCLFTLEKKSVFKLFGFCAFMFLIITLTNPLFSHNGRTVLFFINDNRVTFEALVYGAVLGLAVIEVLIWFKCFSTIFDSERIIFHFGKISPKTALVLSMTLRFIPNFVSDFKSINTTQRLIGSNSRIKRYLNSFSAVITQSLENSVITSDSMKSRGYGLKGRTFYSRFRFSTRDIVFIIISTVLFALSIIGRTDFVFYPSIDAPSLSGFSIIGCFSFSALSLIPFIYELKEGIRWKYSISKI